MIAIIGFNDLHLMQYLFKYTNVLDSNNIKYDVIFWNRSGVEEGEKKFKCKSISFDYSMDTYKSFNKKISGFLRYTFFVRNLIKKNKYDKLIILTTQTAVPLFDILLSEFKGKYIYDYRDITKEKRLKIYHFIVNKLISSSKITMISSMGFLEALGVKRTEKIVQANNTQETIKHTIIKPHYSKKNTINLVYWGMVRQVEYNKKICDIFGNDLRYNLFFHGAGDYKLLQNYCEVMGYKNVVFTGRYRHDEIEGFSIETDLLHCSYELDDEMKYALQVKIYDGVKYRIPLMVTMGSYTEKYLSPYGISISIDVDDGTKCADRVFEWYQTLEDSKIESGYSEIEKEIYKDDINFERKVLSFVNDEEII